MSAPDNFRCAYESGRARLAAGRGDRRAIVGAMTTVGINGFGRMGRLALRAAWEGRTSSSSTSTSSHGDAATAAHLLTFDSVHGRWPHDVAVDRGAWTSTAAASASASTPRPARCRGTKLGVDVVLECSGKFRTRASLEPYFERGVHKVIVAAPVKDAGRSTSSSASTTTSTTPSSTTC